MFIGIVGLGLIGASLSKAIKLKTEHRVLGHDKNNDVNIKAKVLRVIDDKLGYDNIGKCEILFICLYPNDTIEYLRENCNIIKKDTIVLDCCGVKQSVCQEAFEIAEKSGFTFIGGHPLAGEDEWGFENSKPSLFDGASMVLTPPINISIGALDKVKTIFTRIGFSNIEISTPREHDRIIAFTSELPHLISSAYVKSKTANEHYGFSAESFRAFAKDSKLNEKLWAELMSDNKVALLSELSGLIENLKKYETALSDGNQTELMNLLREGREAKEYIDGKETIFWK